MPRLGLLATLSAAALMLGATDAHNYVLKPLAEFKPGTPGFGNWVDQFSPPWSGDVTTGASFATLAKSHGFTTTRQFLEKRGPDCGYSNPNAKAKAIPSDGKVMLYRSMDHPGPCELWLDDTMVYHNDDCKVAFGTTTPGFKVDFSSCKGSCTLRFYWLGLQNGGQLMQSYKNCIPLVGTGGSSSTTKTSAPTTKAPASPATKAPSTPATKTPSTPATKAPTPAAKQTPSPVVKKTPAPTPKKASGSSEIGSESSKTSAPSPAATKKSCSKKKRV